MNLLLRASSCAVLAALLSCAWPALAKRPFDAGHAAAHTAELAQLRRSQDPMAPVFIVTSNASYEGGIKALASKLGSQRDATGNTLVVAQIRTHQLDELSRHVHDEEYRCGGYFAFNTRAAAERFVRTQRTAQAINTSFAAYAIDNQATVGAWLPQVREAGIRDTISHLSTAWPNRYYASNHGRNAATWIRDTWLAMANGRSDVSAELFTACSNCSTQPSVILTIRGSELPDEIVVLGGHLDSIRQGNPPGTPADSMDAPGADDDASGIATLTEILRVAMANGYRPKRTVMFMGYAAEEVGLRGSNAIAQAFRAQNRNVVGVLQLDMTNWKSPQGTTDIGLISDYSNASLLQFVQDLFATYLAPSGYTMGLSACGYACSDHASWTAAGYPSAMPDEGPIFPYLHTPNDTLQQMGNTAIHSTILARLGLAFLGEIGKNSDVVALPGQVRIRSNAHDVPIADNAVASSSILVTRRNGSAPALTPVAVRIVHPARGELKVDLVAPDGTVYNLANRSGGTTDNIVETYAVDLSAESMNGKWVLRVDDNAAGNSGIIDSWSISL